MFRSEAIARLKANLKSISDEQKANAAVALLLKPKRDDFEILLVKRVNNPSDPWSGQMALPGGKRELKDVSLIDTVIRETLEETGIVLSKKHFLGVLDAVRSDTKPTFRILPFVAYLEKKPTLKLNKGELETYIWVPFRDFIQSKGETDFGSDKAPAFIFADAMVWGLTYEILIAFAKAVEASQEKR